MRNNTSSEYYSSQALPPDFGLFQNVGMAKAKKKTRRPVFFKEFRKDRGLTQDQVAEMTGLSQGTVARIERRQIEFTEETLNLLADAYRCELFDLFKHPDQQNELNKYLISLDKKAQTRAVKVLKAMRSDDEDEKVGAA